MQTWGQLLGYRLPPLICSCKGHSAPPACPGERLILRAPAQLPWGHGGDGGRVTVPWVPA